MSGELKAARKTGDPMLPEGARARRGTTARGGDVRPEATKARFAGDAMSNDTRGKFVPRITRGPQGDSKSMTNPVK